MAYFLPVVVGVAGATGGFIAGYMYQPSETKDTEDIVIIPDLKPDIDKIKSVAPRKDLNKELVEFRKENLKKAKNVKRRPTSEQEMMAALSKKVQSYRKYIKPE